MIRRKISVLGLLWVVLLALTGCGQASSLSSETLKVGATPLPHAELLNFVKPLLEAEGIELEIIEFTDYVTPNLALRDGEIHANFFQHLPYMESFAEEHGLELVSLASIHVEPLGLYSKKHLKLEDIPSGATIAIPNDPTNEGRALLLLEANGLIGLSGEEGLRATTKSIVKNPLNLVFKPIDAAQLPRTLNDVDASVINTNYALEASLNPLNDALLLENAESPYANIITVTQEGVDNPQVLKLIEVLQSQEVKDFIEKEYQGAVVPAF